MIEIDNIRKSYGELNLFNNFSYKISRGEFVVFSGKSGSGKTTLLNMIGGIEAVDEGRILVNGIDICKKKNQLNYYRYGVGFLFQNFALVENKTVTENLKIVRNKCRTNEKEDVILDKVGLLDKKYSKVYTLSGGEQQRVALARLMYKKCDIILADEPTGSLDTENKEKVLSILEDLNKNGKTIIIVTHDEGIKSRYNRGLKL